MQKFKLISSLLLLSACSGKLYEDLSISPVKATTLAEIRPKFNNTLYRTNVDIMGKSLSGLLLLKLLPDGTTRVVFTNEVGLKFFDFSFGPQRFEVVYCIDQLNKKAVINQLQQDIGSIIMQNINFTAGKVYQTPTELYYQFTGDRNTRLYYITDKQHQIVKRIENTTERKQKLVIELFEPVQHTADSIFLDHKLYKFSISLKRIK